VLARLLAAVMMLALLGVVGLGLLATSDYVGQASRISGTQNRLLWTLAHGDHLHFAVHMVAGRLLDLCPCTRHAAAVQYVRASYHAKTATELALVRNARPTSAHGWLAYTVAPAAVVVEWIGNGISWLAVIPSLLIDQHSA
jgi:uncharacterized membrane protein YedE/YeeE